MTDITVDGHDRGPLYGTEALGFHSVCGRRRCREIAEEVLAHA